MTARDARSSVRRILRGAPIRLLLVALAVAGVVLAGVRLTAVDRCRVAGTDALVLVRDEGDAEAAQGISGRLRDACRGGDDLATAAATFATGRHNGVATGLAREAVRREPENFLAWDALALAIRGTDPAQARRAVARAQQLNPRGRPVAVPGP